MNREFRTTRMVEFFETDMAGIMHFSNFFRFMESAEHAFYRSLGFSVDEAKSLGLGWPRVKAECEYRHPLRFEDVVEIRVSLRRLGTQSITLEFQFFKTEDSQELSVATGAITAVCVERDLKTGGFRPVPIPENIRARIKADANL
jgi:acyl-CoA thioester hydrolase